MQCVNCGFQIPYQTQRCERCGKEYFHNRNTKISPCPPVDRFGNKVFPLIYDEMRHNARNRYLWTLFDIKHLVENKKSRKSSRGWMICTIALLITFIVSTILAIVLKENIMFTFLFGGISAYSFIGCAPCAIVWGVSDKKYKINERELKRHEAQALYYFNDRVFGFSCIDDNGEGQGLQQVPTYNYYEIRKDNILGIQYNTRYAEYVVFLREATYIDCSNVPVREFLIPDIFDEISLTNALGGDLPPRITPF